MSAEASSWSELPRSRRPGFVTALEMATDPEGFFARMRERLGDPFVARMPKIGEVLVTGHPDGARDVFSAPPDLFEPLKDNPVEPLLGRHSLILLAGERHRRERKLMNPPFHGERMRAYGEIIQGRAIEEASAWRADEEVVLQRAVRRITLDVILRAVLGVEGEERAAALRSGVAAMLDAYTAPLLVLPQIRRATFGMGPWDRFVRAKDRVCALFAEEIAARRKSGTEGRADILSLLMDARYDDGSALTDGELVDELRTLIVGGHDTTTTALVWAFLHVHRSPRVLARLQGELEAAGALPRPEVLVDLPYLGAVASEALRMHPVVPVVPRRALRPFTMRGHAVRAGENVCVATTLLHANTEVWSDPSRFHPERFLERKYSPFEYAPFGGGVRRCIGAAFGAYQMKIVLGTVLSLRRFRLYEGTLPERVLMNITMGPRRSVVLHVAA